MTIFQLSAKCPIHYDSCINSTLLICIIISHRLTVYIVVTEKLQTGNPCFADMRSCFNAGYIKLPTTQELPFPDLQGQTFLGCSAPADNGTPLRQFFPHSAHIPQQTSCICTYFRFTVPAWVVLDVHYGGQKADF